MPKKSNKPFWGGGRGRGRANNQDEKHYFGHDDRMSQPSIGTKNFINKPRVSFKKQNFKSSRPKIFVRRHFDEDILMSTSSNNNTRQTVNRGRGKTFLRGRSSPMPRGRNHNATIEFREQNRSRTSLVTSEWYKVTIPRSNKYTKDYILGNLQTCMALPPTLTFTPIKYTMDETCSVFYVEDHKIATRLADCDKRITTNDGSRLQISVRAIQYPPIQICDALKERLKVVMGKRYVQETNALDLSKFYSDPDLASDYYCPLHQRLMFDTVMEIIQEYIPHLLALNLDSNKIYNIERFGYMANKFNCLKILYIGDNKIKDINTVNYIKNLPIEELRLEGNPLCIKYKDKEEHYISDVRKIFPHLLKLDGKELTPPIVFDLDNLKLKLLPTQRMYIAQSNLKAQDVASQFLRQYFAVFDSENRQPLLDAYHEHACFSMTSFIPSGSNKFNPFLLQESRNLLRVIETYKRKKLLKQGRLQVVSFISEMPRTQHDLSSFTMDLSLITEGMMLITVTGLSKDLLCKKNKELLRFFNRTFIIVPEGSGFCISNEQLHISNPTQTQEKEFHTLSQANQPVSGPSHIPPEFIHSVQLSKEMKQQMALKLSQDSRMNVEWSLKCLEEVQWNYEHACSAFRHAFAAGKIPPNAFNE